MRGRVFVQHFLSEKNVPSSRNEVLGRFLLLSYSFNFAMYWSLLLLSFNTSANLLELADRRLDAFQIDSAARFRLFFLFYLVSDKFGTKRQTTEFFQMYISNWHREWVGTVPFQTELSSHFRTLRFRVCLIPSHGTLHTQPTLILTHRSADGWRCHITRCLQTSICRRLSSQWWTRTPRRRGTGESLPKRKRHPPHRTNSTMSFSISPIAIPSG